MSMTKPISNSSKTPKKSWSMSLDKDGVSTTVRVKELDNPGFLVSVNRYGRKNDKGDYYDDSKEFYSPTNPLENNPDAKEDKGEEESDIMEVFDKWSKLLK